MLQTCSKDKPGSQEHGCPGGPGGVSVSKPGGSSWKGTAGHPGQCAGPTERSQPSLGAGGTRSYKTPKRSWGEASCCWTWK